MAGHKATDIARAENAERPALQAKVAKDALTDLLADQPNKQPASTRYSIEKADEICKLIRSGQTVLSICKREDMPNRMTFYEWLDADKDGLQAKYEAATTARADVLADLIIDVSFDSSRDWIQDNYMKGKTPGYKVDAEAVARSKLEVEALMWHAGKMKPTKYGPKVDITTGGEKLPTPIYQAMAKDVKMEADNATSDPST